jgi:hypothetical protein
VADFERVSRVAGPGEMPAPFAAALDAHAELVGAGDSPLAGVRASAVTDSTPHSRGLLRRRRPHSTWIAVTGEHLVVVGDASGAPVASLYRLAELEARPFESPLATDEGLDVVAMPVGGGERVSVFVPLAPGPAREAILAALS